MNDKQIALELTKLVLDKIETSNNIMLTGMIKKDPQKFVIEIYQEILKQITLDKA